MRGKAAIVEFVTLVVSMLSKRKRKSGATKQPPSRPGKQINTNYVGTDGLTAPGAVLCRSTSLLWLLHEGPP